MVTIYRSRIAVAAIVLPLLEGTRTAAFFVPEAVNRPRIGGCVVASDRAERTIGCHPTSSIDAALDLE